ncbi:MAG: histidine phosphatase family protein [Lachnospiraceae bacterium]|nr:histidine phosphatase family protein [Lachnospiraceae bacterium]
MKITLLRHALTGGNSKKKYIGCRTDDALSAEGRTAAYRAAGSSVFSQNAVIFSGPLLRCRQTAEILFPGREITLIDELTETDFGIFEGRTYEELKNDKVYRLWVESAGKKAPPGGEGADDFLKRSMKGFLRAAELSESAGEAYIVCCGGNIMAIMKGLTGLGLYDHQAGCLEGYVISFERHGAAISDVSYERIGYRDRT